MLLKQMSLSEHSLSIIFKPILTAQMRSYMQSDRRLNHKSNAIDQNRTFTSPGNRVLTDYNSYMYEQKHNHPKREFGSPNYKVNKTQLASALKENQNVNDLSYRNHILLRQNNYLLCELIKCKSKENKPKKNIEKINNLQSPMKKVKEIPTYISIEDRQNIKCQPSQSKLFTSICTLKTSQDEEKSCRDLFNTSIERIEEAGNSFAKQIDILNQKLSRLLQQSSCEPLKDRRQQKRLQVFQCVEQLKQLRKYYQQLRC